MTRRIEDLDRAPQSVAKEVESVQADLAQGHHSFVPCSQEGP